MKSVRGCLQLAGLVVLLGMASGCEDARQKVATAIAPASAAEVTASVGRQVTAGKFQDAIKEGESFLATNTDASGKLAWELAKASAQAADVERAVRYATEAVKAGAVAPVSLMGEPLLEPVRTDLRMVSLAAGLNGGPVTASPAVVPSATAGTDAQATISADGVEASAGDVSVKLPD